MKSRSSCDWTRSVCSKISLLALTKRYATGRGLSESAYHSRSESIGKIGDVNAIHRLHRLRRLEKTGIRQEQAAAVDNTQRQLRRNIPITVPAFVIFSVKSA